MLNLALLYVNLEYLLRGATRLPGPLIGKGYFSSTRLQRLEPEILSPASANQAWCLFIWLIFTFH
jgi:hypothetical protein